MPCFFNMYQSKKHAVFIFSIFFIYPTTFDFLFQCHPPPLMEMMTSLSETHHKYWESQVLDKITSSSKKAGCHHIVGCLCNCSQTMIHDSWYVHMCMTSFLVVAFGWIVFLCVIESSAVSRKDFNYGKQCLSGIFNKVINNLTIKK